MSVSPFDEDTHEVEIHKRLPSGQPGAQGAQAKIGVTHYQCSTIKCTFVSEDKVELPTRVTTETNPGSININTK